jgi:hypothetical protein
MAKGGGKGGEVLRYLLVRPHRAWRSLIGWGAVTLTIYNVRRWVAYYSLATHFAPTHFSFLVSGLDCVQR